MKNSIVYRIYWYVSLVISVLVCLLFVLMIFSDEMDFEYDSGDFIFFIHMLLLTLFCTYSIILLIRNYYPRKTSKNISIVMFIILAIWMISQYYFEEDISVVIILMPVFFIPFFFYNLNKVLSKNSIPIASDSIINKLNPIFKGLDLFKIATIVFMIIFLVIFNNYTKNNRFQSIDDNTIIDSRTGIVYRLDYDGTKYVPNSKDFPLRK